MMAARSTRGEKVSTVELRQMNRVLELAPEDMTVTVESGVLLGALQGELRKHGQWLPIDPPNAGRISIHDILARDLSGPRRFGYGTIREHLIGLKVVLADGRTIKSGGKVVKNVAGYDLAKLFIGAWDSLGIIVEATFKLRPLPATEAIVGVPVPIREVGKMMRAVLDSDLTPTILDAHRVQPGETSPASLVLGFAGTAQEVEWQLGVARTLGFTTRASLDYEDHFWNDPIIPSRVSVLPSRLGAAIAELDSLPFVARAGNGVIYFRGDPSKLKKTSPPTELMRRLKMTYDPKHILPELTL